MDNLKPPAQASIPIHVVGQADSALPVQDNTDLVEKRCKRLGGTIEAIRKTGGGHQSHSLPNPEPIVHFILAHQQ